jgi:CAI-1 autoinducer synthase
MSMTISSPAADTAGEAAERRLSAHVEARMDEHYVERVARLLGGEHMHQWRPAGRDAIQLAGNDYLCIGAEPALIQAQIDCLARTRSSQLMSAVFLQAGSAQHRLERKLARHMQAEDGVLAQSGWAANVGLLQSIAGPGVPVYLDMLAHASLWEGVLSAGAQAVPFVHNDTAHLARQVGRHGAGVIVVDALYSTNGSVCPLARVVELAEAGGCMLVVDESHSLGTHGPRGAGLTVQLGLAERVHFRTASLAKAFAGRAGFITCSSKFKGYFLSASRPAIFSSCLLAHELAWFDAALDFIAGAEDRRLALRYNTQVVRTGLAALGYNLEDGTEQIVALEAGTEPKTLALRKALESRGVQGAVFCAPATPKNRALVRLTLNSGLTPVELTRLLEVCAAIREEVGLAHCSSTRRAARPAPLRLAA